MPVFWGHVDTGGRLHVDGKAIKEAAREFAGKAIEIVLRARQHKRSIPANRRYWALITVASRELGYDVPEELHDGIAQKLLALPPLVPGVPRRRSTKDLTTAEFAEYTDGVERYFRMELGLDLSGWQDEIERIEAA